MSLAVLVVAIATSPLWAPALLGILMGVFAILTVLCALAFALIIFLTAWLFGEVTVDGQRVN